MICAHDLRAPACKMAAMGAITSFRLLPACYCSHFIASARDARMKIRRLMPLWPWAVMNACDCGDLGRRGGGEAEKGGNAMDLVKISLYVPILPTLYV